jgi:LysM repeat protein
MGRLVGWLLLTGVLWGITVTYPPQDTLVTDPSLTVTLAADANYGFYYLNNHIGPLRKHTVIPNIPLRMGSNDLWLSLLNHERFVDPTTRRQIRVYRALPIADAVTPFEAYVITELAVHHNISLLNTHNQAQITEPIRKRDWYALIVWAMLHTNRSGGLGRIHRRYTDMLGYEPYVALYNRYPTPLPPPFKGQFIPNAYMTRVDCVNSLGLFQNGQDQSATTHHIDDVLVVPQSLAAVIPNDWVAPLQLVSKRDAIAIVKRYATIPDRPIPQMIEMPAPAIPNTVPQRFASEWVAYGRSRLTHYRDWLFQARRQSAPDGATASTTPAAAKKTAEIPPVGAPPIGASPKPVLAPKKPTETPSSPPQKPSPAPSTEWQTIQVKPGDSIQKIAKCYYGDPQEWRSIAEDNALPIKTVTINGRVNHYVHIVPNQSLRVPLNAGGGETPMACD